jgi:hypothetical protein
VRTRSARYSVGMGANSLTEELAWYAAHRSELVAHQDGQYVLVRASSMRGVFPTEVAALEEGYRQFGEAPFLVRKITASDGILNFSSMNIGL